MSNLKKAVLMIATLIFCFTLGEGVLVSANVTSSVGGFLEENISENQNSILKRKKSSYRSKKSKTRKVKTRIKKGFKFAKRHVFLAIIILVVVLAGIFFFIKMKS